MSKKGKGNNNQRKFANYMRHYDFEVEIVRNVQWNHGDYFDVADIIAINPEYWVIVQVKSNGTYGAITQVKEKVMPSNTIKLVVARYDAKKGMKPYKAFWKIYNVDNGKKIKVYEDVLYNLDIFSLF